MGWASLFPSCSCSTPLPLTWIPTTNQRPLALNIQTGFSSFRALCSSDISLATATDVREKDVSMTGGAFDFKGASISLTDGPLSSSKKVTLVRHGLSSWNEESRIQGSSDLSILTDTGAMQAEKCRRALANLSYDRCFSSPISRAKSSAELIWHGREQPLVFLDTLKEAHLFFLEGMKNGLCYFLVLVFPASSLVMCVWLFIITFSIWRQRMLRRNIPNCILHGEKIQLIFRWMGSILSRKYGERQKKLGVKSYLRPFRALDVNNCGISVFVFNKRGEAMLQCLNMTAHMYTDHMYKY